MKKWANDLNSTFLKEEVQMANKHMNKCSPSLSIKEMHIKTKLIFYLTSCRTALSSRTPPTTNVGEDARKRNPHTLLVGM
jgi:hypothetical protein